MKNKFKKQVILILFLGLLVGCHEEIAPPLKINSSNVKAPEPPYPFDWETAEYVPTPSNISIRVPWANGVNALYDLQIRYDFKKIDGWKLLYNTFNPNTFQNGSFFALYNKYRGILRFYFYIMPNNNFYSNHLEDDLVVYSANGKTTSFFNFAEGEVIDPALKAMQTRAIKDFAVPSEGGWYVSELDVAYDPNLKNLVYSDISIKQTLKFWNVQQTTLSGKITGTAEEVSVHTTPPLTIANLLSNVLPIGAVLSSLHKVGLDTTVKADIETAKNNGVNSIIKGLTNLIVTGNPLSGSTQTHFKIDLNADFTGTNTSTGSVKENFLIAMPGVSNATSGSGPVPADNLPLGILGLQSRPVVIVKNNKIPPKQCLASYGMSTDAYEYTFYLNTPYLMTLCASNSNNIYNPELLKVAHVTQGYSYYWTGGGPPGPKLEILVGSYNTNAPNGVQIVGKSDCSYMPDIKVAGTYMKNIAPAKNGASGGIIGNGIFRYDTPVYLRITFDVIPKDGSPKTTIIKTFKCNVSNWL